MKCAVLGDPVAHSLSPVLHRAGYAAAGLDWSYVAVQVRAGDLEAFLRSLDGEWRGLSLTMPLKREAMPLAASVSERATLVGAANTLVRAEDGWHADNTDLPGAVAAVRERYDGPITSATILGGGATAASTGLAMAELGAESIRVAVRDPARAGETRDRIAAHPGRPVVEVVSLEAVSDDTDVVVSTIPADAQTDDLVARCGGVEVLFDVIYHPWPTPLVAAAGGAVVSGLDLLVHQAALQFLAFTGVPAPLAAMREAGEAELAVRAGEA